MFGGTDRRLSRVSAQRIAGVKEICVIRYSTWQSLLFSQIVFVVQDEDRYAVLLLLRHPYYIKSSSRFHGKVEPQRGGTAPTCVRTCCLPSGHRQLLENSAAEILIIADIRWRPSVGGKLECRILRTSTCSRSDGQVNVALPCTTSMWPALTLKTDQREWIQWSSRVLK